MNISDLKKRFVRVCINRYTARDIYKSSDLMEFAEQALQKGEEYFYASTDSKGNLYLDEPKYVYRMARALSEDEYKMFFDDRVDELHLIMDNNNDLITETTVEGTLSALKKYNIVYTTIPTFLSFDYAKRLFVRVRDEIYEITLGYCEGSDKEIRVEHNLCKLLLAGHFDWYHRGCTLEDNESDGD